VVVGWAGLIADTGDLEPSSIGGVKLIPRRVGSRSFVSRKDGGQSREALSAMAASRTSADVGGTMRNANRVRLGRRW